MLRINSKLARALSALGLATAVALIGLVAGCDGPKSSSSTSGSGSTSSGSGSTSGNAAVSSTPATLANNQMAVVVSSGLTGTAPNMPMVSVKVCVHGTTNCQTINDIQLDTGSFGLRLAADAVSSTLLSALPNETVSGQFVAECMGFADGNAWGSVRTADVTLGGETASNIPVHIMGDVAQSAAGGTSNACASGSLNDSSAQISAHGILGIGTAKYDCGSGTAGCTSAPNGVYFGCTSSGSTTTCGDLGVPVTQQVANPIQFFATDNNGVILNMPAVGTSGATSASGYLTFGIGSQSNNTVPSSGIQTITTDHYGTTKTASLSGTSVAAAFFDTGSNGLFFTDSSITKCTRDLGFYCPSSTLARQPSVTGYNGTTESISLSIANAESLLGVTGSSGVSYAFTNVGGSLATTSAAFDFGMPFFFGRTVYVNYDPSAIASFGAASPAYVAF